MHLKERTIVHLKSIVFDLSQFFLMAHCGISQNTEGWIYRLFPELEVQPCFLKIKRETAMTSTDSCKLIRYDEFYPRKDSTNSRPNDRHHHHRASHKNHDPPHPNELSRTDPDFGGQLRAHENIARHKFSNIKSNLKLELFPSWLDRKLGQSILPTLQRIGFDAQIARALFELTPADWKFMGPVNEKVIVFRPEINHDIAEVIAGLERRVVKNSGNSPRLEGTSPAFMTGTISDRASPEYLFELLDEIDTSWITLPRAFRFLEKEHSGYLPQYLKTLDRDTSESCLKVFSRIITEFMGNFALKFADRHHSPDQIEKLLFYGYSAMYWKTLRKPPTTMENSAAFDHFLNWISRLARRSSFLGSEAVRSVNQMIKFKSEVFPKTKNHQLQTCSWQSKSRFVITLRHGPLGIAAMLNFMGIDQFLKTRQIHGQSPFQSNQNELYRLLHTIQIGYYSESRKTRGYIRQFIGHLKSAYGQSQPAFHRPERKFLFRMINNLQILFNK